MTDQRHGLGHRLARLDRTTVFLAALTLGVAGLFLPGWAGAGLLVAVVAALIMVARLTWPVTPAPMRIVRVMILTALVAVAVAKLI